MLHTNPTAEGLSRGLIRLEVSTLKAAGVRHIPSNSTATSALVHRNVT
jgi:hypothetical protein